MPNALETKHLTYVIHSDYKMNTTICLKLFVKKNKIMFDSDVSGICLAKLRYKCKVC